MSPDHGGGERGKDAGQPAQQSAFVNVLLPVLTVVGTGIGAIGFVIFFGGFIVWARFKATGLPANEAVAQVPRSDLVVTGASFLVPALLAALAAVAVVVMARHLLIGSKRKQQREDHEAALLDADSDLRRLRAAHDRLKRKIKALDGRLERLRQEEAHFQVGSTDRERVRLAGDVIEGERNQLDAECEALEEEEIPAAELKQANLTKAAPKAKLSKTERLPQVLIGGAPMLIAEVVVISLGFGGLSYLYRGFLVFVVLVTIALAVGVLSMTGHFSWFALCVFLGVGLTIAASTYARTQSHPRISPIAALVGPAPVTGFFVAETSDAIYFGVPERFDRLLNGELVFNHHGATLVRTPKSLVSGLTVGPLMDEAHAYRRSIVLALSLCHQAKLATAPAGHPRATKKKPQRLQGCSPWSTRRLRRLHRAATPHP